MPNTPTIRALLCGGLGNQLFQYAFARALALRSGVCLELDAATLFERDHVYHRIFELDAFQLPDEVRVLCQKPIAMRLRRKFAEVWSREKPLDRRTFVGEPRPLRYYPEFASWKVRRDVILLGYWQCEDYFKEYEATIRRDLTFKTPLHAARSEHAAQVRDCPSIAVHVRRSQYARLLDLEYYRTAMRRLRESVSGARFFVFTDDPAWWKSEGLDGPDTVLVEPVAGLPAVEDFKLMTRCRHFIIANSSFSWWAAWLGGRREKIVIHPGPETWDNADAFPKSWEAGPALWSAQSRQAGLPL